MHFFGVASFIFILPSSLILTWFCLHQIAFWLGLGMEFAVLNRPLLTVSLSALMFGVLMFITGFVCDFFLHHVIRSRIGDILDLMIDTDKPEKG